MTTSAATRRPLIEFKNVNHDFGNRPILRDIDLSIRKSEFVCLIGPSGCGKTTLLRMVGGLLKQTSGEVTFNGKPVDGPAKEISFMFQDYSKALLPWRTAAGNVSLALEATGVPSAQRTPRIAELLHKVGLAIMESIFRRSSPAGCSSACRSRAVSPRTHPSS